MKKFGAYATDNFVFRETFRTTRALMVFDVFMQNDKSGLYYDSNVGAGKFDRLNETSIKKAAAKIQKLCEFFPGLDVYVAVIPDKSEYAKRYLPGFDIDEAQWILSSNLTGVTLIDLKDAVSGGDFYRTDIHWDQSRLLRDGGVLDVFGEKMSFADRLDKSLGVKTAGTFDGVYTGQLALPLKRDTMTYMTGGVVDAAVVSYFNPTKGEWEDGPMYDVAAVNGRDPYDVFLRGVQPLIMIENPSATTDRQLYLFRDSFGSSFAPLLVSAYRRIVVIDMRYIHSVVLEEYIPSDGDAEDINSGEVVASMLQVQDLLTASRVLSPTQRGFAGENADVLFMYSSQILNNPDILMVN
jgi:hypothetical protein